MLRTYLFPDPERVTEEQLAREWLPALPAWRRAQALKFRHHLGQVLNAKAFLLLKEGLAADFNIHEELFFDYVGQEKPVLRNHPDIHFNLSHCKKGVLCVIDDQNPVGCDIEVLDRNISDVLLKRCCNEQEISKIQSATKPTEEFIKLWTIKEAVLKQTGTGLVDDLPSLLTPALCATLRIETHVCETFAYTVCSV